MRTSVDVQGLEHLLVHLWQMSRVGRYAPLLVWGEAGIGKSETVRRAADTVGIDFIDLRLGTMEAPDLMGVMRDAMVYPCLFCLENAAVSDPLSTGERYTEDGLWHHSRLHHADKIPANFVTDPIGFVKWMIGKLEQAGYSVYFESRTVYSAPMWFPAPETSGILFLDEMNRSQRDTRQGVFQLVLDRRIHELELPPGWIVVSANNPPKLGDPGAVSGYDVAEIYDRAFLSRFCHVVLEPDAAEWMDYAREVGILPDIRSVIANDTGGKLLGLKKGLALPALSPSPRSWVMVSRILASVIVPNETPKVLSREGKEIILLGMLGGPVAEQYLAFEAGLARVEEAFASRDQVRAIAEALSSADGDTAVPQYLFELVVDGWKKGALRKEKIEALGAEVRKAGFDSIAIQFDALVGNLLPAVQS